MGVCRLVVKGLESFPNSVDLLADAVLHSNSFEGDKHISALVDLGFDRWNWRAFLFSIDHILDVELVLGSDKEINSMYIEYAMKLANKFIDRFPSDERSYRCKVKMLQEHNGEGDQEEAENIYRTLIIDGKVPGATDKDRRFPVAQCCTGYIDLLLERGDYEDVIKAAEVGIASTAQEQPSANMGHFFYARALAENSLLQQKCCKDNQADAFSKNRYLLESAMCDYKLAMLTLGRGNSFETTIRRRSTMLAVLGGVDGLDESLFTVDLSSVDDEDLLREIARRGVFSQSDMSGV